MIRCQRGHKESLTFIEEIALETIANNKNKCKREFFTYALFFQE
jgi:hypothetical protein